MREELLHRTGSWKTIYPDGPPEPTPHYPTFSSPIGLQITALSQSLREARQGDPVKQFTIPRKTRTKRAGDVSLAEYGRSVGIGPRAIFKVLLKTGMLQKEITAYECNVNRTRYLHRARLTPAAVELGLGRRIEPNTGYHYDVLTPKGQAYATMKLAEQRNQQSTKVSTPVLRRDHIRELWDQGMTAGEIITETGIPKATVYRHISNLTIN